MILMEESGTWLPDPPSNSGEVSRRKALDAAQIFSLQKKDGFSFKVANQDTVSKLAVLEDLEVVRDVLGRRDNGDQ